MQLRGRHVTTINALAHGDTPPCTSGHRLAAARQHCRLVDSSDERSLFTRTGSLSTIKGHLIGVRIKLNSFAVEAQCYNWSSPHLPSPPMERITRSIFATDEAEYRLHQSEYRLPTIADPVRGQSTNRAATQDIFVYEDKRPCYERLWFLSSGSPCPLGYITPTKSWITIL
jgi:hypothetical protein